MAVIIFGFQRKITFPVSCSGLAQCEGMNAADRFSDCYSKHLYLQLLVSLGFGSLSAREPPQSILWV